MYLPQPIIDCANIVRAQGDFVQRYLQPQRQRVPLRLRMDHEPARRILHLRLLRHVQPKHRVNAHGHGHLRRRDIRHLQDRANERTFDLRHADVQSILVRPPKQARRRHDHDVEPLQRVEGARHADGRVQLSDPRDRGLPEQWLIVDHHRPRRGCAPAHHHRTRRDDYRSARADDYRSLYRRRDCRSLRSVRWHRLDWWNRLRFAFHLPGFERYAHYLLATALFNLSPTAYYSQCL